MAGNNNNMTMFIELSSWRDHCENLLGSFDECIIEQHEAAANLLDQSSRL